MTERARYVFTVKEYNGGQPWIRLENSREDLTPLKEGFLGLDLLEGTSYEEARNIAKYLNSQIANVTYTDLRTIKKV
jgi:hypothetical protein